MLHLSQEAHYMHTVLSCYRTCCNKFTPRPGYLCLLPLLLNAVQEGTRIPLPVGRTWKRWSFGSASLSSSSPVTLSLEFLHHQEVLFGLSSALVTLEHSLSGNKRVGSSLLFLFSLENSKLPFDMKDALTLVSLHAHSMSLYRNLCFFTLFFTFFLFFNTSRRYLSFFLFSIESILQDKETFPD